MVDTIEPAGPSKGIADRAKAIIMSPKTEWPVIAAEGDSVQTVFLKYVVPLAAIGPIASLIGGQVFGFGGFGFSYRPSLMTGLTLAITQYILSLVGVFLVAWVANFLSPKFGGKDNFAAAFKWVAYAYTAAWVTGIVGIIPALGLLVLLAGLYSLYTLYLGVTPMTSVPQDKAGGFTAVTVIAAIVVYYVVFTVAGSVSALFAPSPYSTIASVDGGASEMNIDLGEYGQMKVTDNGNGNSTVELPGMGTVQTTQDGNVVKIQGEGFNAEVTNSPAAAE